MTETPYIVVPRSVPTPVLALTEEERARIPGLALANAIVLWLFVGIIVAVMAAVGLPALVTLARITPDVAALIGAISAIPVASFALWIVARSTKKKHISDAEQAKARDVRFSHENAVKRAEDEAKSLTTALMHLYESSKKLVRELRENLDQASNWLQHAEGEFRENAFDPFWVAVENGAKNLAGYNSKARTLSENANQYHLKLKDREHTFPVFPIQGKTIPDASFAVREFRRIVRMGQTEPTFAIIEQHRRTREVLIAGFRTLSDAVNNLGANFETSVHALRESVTSDLAKSIGEGIKTRESFHKRMVEQNRMLDNIQQHRKPSLIEEPSKY